MATLDKPAAEQQAGFAELHCLTNHSFLRGASHPEELVYQAKAMNYKAIAITDECSYAGLVKAHIAAKECGIKLIVGAEFEVNLDDSTLYDAPNAKQTYTKIVLLATNRQTYGQISALITKLRRRSEEKGAYNARLDDFRWGLSGCLALWAPPNADISHLAPIAEALQQLLPDLWIALELFRDGHDLDKTANALTLSMRFSLPIVASNDVHTHTPSRQTTQDLLTAIRHKTTVTQLGYRAFPNAERTLRSLEDLHSLYPPEMLQESLTIAERCQFSMDELRYEYPQDLVPPHLSPSKYLRQLTLAGAAERWPEGVPEDTMALINKELQLIAELKYEHYFLTVQDIVQFARSQNILCQGRGSAANSAVCYCLHVTEVDPARMHLLFERFVSKERDEPPDIDVDFEHERREEVIQYIYKRYGRDRAALAATLITYRPRSAIRDVGKALGLSQDSLDLLAKSMAWWDKPKEMPTRFRAAGLDPDSHIAQQFLYFVGTLLGFPRHLSQHVGGFVIAQGTLAQLVPVENAAMPDRTIIQWDKDDLEALGLLKVDVLALGMLTAIRKALDLVNTYRGTQLTIQNIPAEDPDTYRLLQDGDSVGVFQVESRAQMAMLPRLKPQHFYDLVIEVAIVRPGPIQGDMVHPYLRRRQGKETVTYPSEGVRKVLERTLGVPIFQEQVIELAMVAAGFSAGEADRLRRAMAAWKKRGGLEEFEQKLIDGMLARGHDQAFAERVFKQIKGFGDYGFPESHAASFALLVYISAWLKCHEGAAFYCGLLNSLPMGFYSPSQLIQDAQRHNIQVLPIDVCHSEWDHTLIVDECRPKPFHSANNQGSQFHATEQPALLLGMRMIKGLQEETALSIIEARHQAQFESVEDLASRANVNDQGMRFLARAGALRSLSGNRHQAHWQVAGIKRPIPLLEHTLTHAPADQPSQQVAEPPPAYQANHEEPSASGREPSASYKEPSVILTEPTAGEDMLNDYRYTGLTLGAHPLALLRQTDPIQSCRCASDLEHLRQGQLVTVAGLVTGRQRPGTATGVVFVTLEDETGNLNIVVWSSVMTRFRAALLQGQLLIIKGVVEREGKVIHVVAGHVQDATYLLQQMTEPNFSIGQSNGPLNEPAQIQKVSQTQLVSGKTNKQTVQNSPKDSSGDSNQNPSKHSAGTQTMRGNQSSLPFSSRDFH